MSEGVAEQTLPIQIATLPKVLPAEEAAVDYTIPEFIDKTEAGIRIRDAGYLISPPDDRQFTAFEKINFNLIVNYLKGQLATDDFPDTFTSEEGSQRERWIEKQPPPTQDWLLQNRIRRQNIGKVATALSAFMSPGYSQQHQVSIDKDPRSQASYLISYLISPNGELSDTSLSNYPDGPYHSLPLQEKLDVVKQVDKTAIDFLRQNGFTVSSEPVFVFPKFVDADKVGLKIIDAGYITTPPHVTGPTSVVINKIINNINGPLITDNLSDHEGERRPYRMKQPSQSALLLKTNRIGLNSGGGIVTSLKSLLFFIDQKYEAFANFKIDQDMRQRIESLSQEFDNIKEGLVSYRITYRDNDGETEIVKHEIIPDSQARQEEKERRKQERAGIPKGQTWTEIMMASNPDKNANSIPLEKIKQMADKATRLGIDFLTQNHFVVQSRPFVRPSQ